MSIGHPPSTPLVDAVRRSHGAPSSLTDDLEATLNEPGGGELGQRHSRPRSNRSFHGPRVGRHWRRTALLLTLLVLVGVVALPRLNFSSLLRRADGAATDLARSNPTVNDALNFLGFPRLRTATGLAPICDPVRPIFLYGFAELRVRIGDKMGQPLECERAIFPSGDTNQRTTTGLAYYRSGVNIPSFVNGLDHWALTEQGMVHWIGDVVDPPANAERSPTPTPQP
jgi:hypothetical protein